MSSKEKCEHQDEIDQVLMCTINHDIKHKRCPGLCAAYQPGPADTMRLTCKSCGQLVDADVLADGLADDRERLLAFINDALQNGFVGLDAVLLVSELSE